MKIKGRKSDTWHKNIDETVGARKPTDANFPWIALQNHTGYYLKKKGKLSQSQIDACLLNLIYNHQSKDVAIAACAHTVSAQAVRNLLATGLKLEPNIAWGPHEYLQLIATLNRVNAGAVSEIEAKWASCLLEYAAAGGSSRNSGQQLHNILPLLSARLAPGLFLEADITKLACNICLDFAVHLEKLRHENQWVDAHAAARWLSIVSVNDTLRMPKSKTKHLLDVHLHSWGAWAAWRPHVTRMRAWTDYASLAPSSLNDLLALEGPDFTSKVGSEQATLQKGLIVLGSRHSQSTVQWGKCKVIFKRNPFKELETLVGILERLMSVIDFACSAGREYTALLLHVCVGKIISNEALQILEGVRILGNPAFTTVILRAFTHPKQSSGQQIEEIRRLVPILSDSRICGLREQVKPYVVSQISSHVRHLQNAFLIEMSNSNQWEGAAMELLIFTCGLHEEPWLLAELSNSVQLPITSGPSLKMIEVLVIIRNTIRSATPSSPTPLLTQIDSYCKARLTAKCTIAPGAHELVEALIDVWQQHRDEDYRELALLVADLPSISNQLRCECLRDLPSLTYSWVISTLMVLKFLNGNPELGIFTLTGLLASEEKLDRLTRWRQVLLFALEKQHETLLKDTVTNLGVEMWLKLLDSIRAIYKGSEVIKESSCPKLLSLELHTWSQQLAVYLPTLTRLESMLKHGPTMQMLLLGSATHKNAQLLQILDLVKNSEHSCHETLVDIIIALLNNRNADEVEDVLLAVSKASSGGVDTCLVVLESQRQVSPKITEVVLASKLRDGGLSEQDLLALKKLAGLLGIILDAEGFPSKAGLEEVANSLRKQYLRLITEAQRLENLRLSLRAVAPQQVSELLKKLYIEAPSVVDDTLASLPPSIGSLVEQISKDEIELQFPAPILTKMQRFAIGASDTENFLIRLTLGDDGVPHKFCVHLSGKSSDEMNSKISSNGNNHTPWEIFRSDKPPHEQYCRGRPNRGVYQLSRILWYHLRQNFKSVEQTHSYVVSKFSSFGQGCLVCGLGERRLQRATTCPSASCQSIFSEAHVEIQLAELWQDQPVMDLLLTMIYAAASTGSLDLLVNCPVSDARALVSMLDGLPAISALETHLTSSLNVFGDDFRLAQALVGYCSPSSNSSLLAASLLWGRTSYRGFIVSAVGLQRIPSFGNNQFLLVNTAPDLEAAFYSHMDTPYAVSQILFHGTSLDRLHSIICQGLRVQSGTALQRHGAHSGPGIYMADEPSMAWGYVTASAGGWKSSNLKNMSVLLGCELAGPKPQSGYGMSVITDATRLAVRYIFLLESFAIMPAAKDVRLPMESLFQSLRSGTL